MDKCPLCQNGREIIFTAKVLGKYPVEYSACRHCGLIQTQEPTWLEDAYAEAISVLDTGIISRNIDISAKLTVLLSLGLKRLGVRYIRVRSGLHVMTDARLSPLAVRIMASGFFSKLYALFYQRIRWRDSRTASDMQVLAHKTSGEDP